VQELGYRDSPETLFTLTDAEGDTSTSSSSEEIQVGAAQEFTITITPEVVRTVANAPAPSQTITVKIESTGYSGTLRLEAEPKQSMSGTQITFADLSVPSTSTQVDLSADDTKTRELEITPPANGLPPGTYQIPIYAEAESEDEASSAGIADTTQDAEAMLVVESVEER